MIGANVLRSTPVWRIGAAIAVLLTCAQFILSARDYVSGSDLRDFGHGYSAAHQVLAEGWHQLYDIATQERYQHTYIAGSGMTPGSLLILPFVNLPPTVLLFIPLTGLPTSLAMTVWVALNTVCAWAALVVGSRASNVRVHPLILAGVTISLLPLVWGLLIGQAVGAFTLLYALAFRDLVRERDLRAGLWLSLVVVIKPQLVVGAGIFLLAQRRWTALAAFIPAVVVLLSVSGLLVGSSGVADYVLLLSRLDSFHGDPLLGLRTSLMVNWRSWFAMLSFLNDSQGLLVSLVAGGLIVAAAGLAWRHPTRDAAETTRAFLCCTAAGLLAAYHAHYQDLSILIPPSLALGLFAWASTARAIGRSTLQTLLSMLLLVVLPGVAWVLVGEHALARAALWSMLAGPGLLLLVGGTLPHAEPRVMREMQPTEAAIGVGA